MAVSLPTLRLHGDYLAMVTLGFGQIVKYQTIWTVLQYYQWPQRYRSYRPASDLGHNLSSMESQYVFI